MVKTKPRKKSLLIVNLQDPFQRDLSNLKEGWFMIHIFILVCVLIKEAIQQKRTLNLIVLSDEQATEMLTAHPLTFEE